ncbi:uncharacterized protein SRS1_11700 [Sporisorium reilianum f. sp. reilianum]|uniref:Methyltransferase type 11 domain-containing protein n=1 Tax=Sporisorium reilianum f. sp. reilianum TaxID=72559 RepID=A0A2N8U5P2_9BASI|nr:uncharacterized protein SRS1_11700 [Sporisorium reilianum f. sp. reilianum]
MSDTKNSQLTTDANKAFYALTAAEYDKMGRGMVVEVAKTNAANILARVPGIDPATTELMDFAAGTGLLAMLLAPRCKSVTALNQSDAMIQQLRNKLDAQTDPSGRIDNIVPIVADILEESAGGPLEGKRFDVITCTNSYHHLSDPKKVTQVLARYLKPGGYLAVVDLIKTERSSEFHNAPKTAEQDDGSHKQVVDFGAKSSDEHIHGHHHHHHHGHSQGHGHSGNATHHHEHVIAHRGGFTDAEMNDFFSAAHLKLVNMGKSAQFVKDGKTYDNFLAIAQKPE